jgi:DNA-binding NarL/FixJ family response regulator
MTTSTPKPRIILADDFRPMLEEVSRLLEQEFEIVAAVSNGALAVEAVADRKPDAVLLDIHMPEMSGIEAAQQLRRLGSSARIIFLTIEKDPEYVRLATALSACYVVKSRMPRDLIFAIKEALAGRLFVSST